MSVVRSFVWLALALLFMSTGDDVGMWACMILGNIRILLT